MQRAPRKQEVVHPSRQLMSEVTHFRQYEPMPLRQAVMQREQFSFLRIQSMHPSMPKASHVQIARLVQSRTDIIFMIHKADQYDSDICGYVLYKEATYSFIGD